jgi:hypothetical protein
MNRLGYDFFMSLHMQLILNIKERQEQKLKIKKDSKHYPVQQD